MESARSRIVALTRGTTLGGIFLLVFLVPLLFLPYTVEFYEFNKSVLFLGVMLVVVVSWLINVAFTGTVSFLKTSFDGWIFGVLGVSLLSLIFSIDAVTSALGYSGRLSEGVIILMFMVAMTFIGRQVITSLKIIEGLLWCVLVSSALLSLISVLHFSGVFLFEHIDQFETTAVRAFTTVGSPNVLPFFLLTVLVFGMGLLISHGMKPIKALIATVLLSSIALGFSVSAGNFWSWPGIVLWAVLVGALVYVIVLSGKWSKMVMGWIIIVGVALAGGFLLRNVPAVTNAVVGEEAGAYTVPSLQYDVSWRIAASTLSQSPVRGLLGSGPDTFPNDFTRFRPAEYNASENWNVRFSRSSSQLLEIMGNVGVLGLVAWMLLFFAVVRWLISVGKENHEYPFATYLHALGAALVVMMICAVVVYFTVSMWFLLWFLLAVVVGVRAVSNPRAAERLKLSLSLSRERISVEEHDILPYIMLVPSVILFVAGSWWLTRFYRAEVEYQQGRIAVAQAQEDEALQDLTESLQHIGNAITGIGYRDSYHADYAVIAVNLLKEYTRKAQDENDDQSYQSIQATLLSVSTRSAEKATELNPTNVRNWESRAYVYQELVKLTGGGYGDALLAAINQALLYDPVRPQLYHQKGVVLSLGGLDDEALEELKTALDLQPLYLPARYDLAMQLDKMGRTDDARKQLEFIQNVLEQNDLRDSTAYTQIREALMTIGTESSAEEDEGVVPEDSSGIEFPSAEEIVPDAEYDVPEDFE